MIYELLDKTLIRHSKEVCITKYKVLEMYKKLKEDKEISGFIYGLGARE